MKPRHLVLVTAFTLLQASLLCVQAAGLNDTDTGSRPRRVKQTGILTDRLTLKERQKWTVIENLVFAEDEQGQPLHPTLRGLWEWIETSGHAVYVEINTNRNVTTCTAGSFSIEQFDPAGERHVAVIRLNLGNIDQAFVGPKVARSSGFIPFDGLRRDERYVEVFGHEMAHAAYILTSLARSHLVQEVIEHTNEMLLSRTHQRVSEPVGKEMQWRLTQRDQLLRELEAQAEGMEEVVWREIFTGQKARGESPLAARRFR